MALPPDSERGAEKQVLFFAAALYGAGDMTRPGNRALAMLVRLSRPGGA